MLIVTPLDPCRTTERTVEGAPPYVRRFGVSGVGDWNLRPGSAVPHFFTALPLWLLGGICGGFGSRVQADCGTGQSE